MMQYTTMRALGNGRLAMLRHQAQRDAMARIGRRQRPTRLAPGLLAALTFWVRRRGAAPGGCGGPSGTRALRGGAVPVPVAPLEPPGIAAHAKGRDGL